MAEIALIDDARLVDTPLLQQQRAKRVARRMHPGTRLGIDKPILDRDRLAKPAETGLGLAGMIGHLAAHHRRPDGKNVVGLIVEIGVPGRHARAASKSAAAISAWSCLPSAANATVRA